jgi:hypothetical protein
MGELLKEFDAQGQRTDTLKEGTLPKLPQAGAAEAAGISEHQRKQAVRVANVPAAEFEAAIDGDNPATVTALAEMGRKIRTVPPDDFRGPSCAMHFGRPDRASRLCVPVLR